MTDVPGAGAITKRMISLGHQIDQATEEAGAASRRVSQAKYAHLRAEAVAFLGAEGSAETRKRVAVLETLDERLELEMAESELYHVRERLRSLRDNMELARSINSAVKAEWAAASSHSDT